MSTLTTIAKRAAVIAAIAASPALLILAVPFGYGIAGDLLALAGTPASLAFTTAVCLAALVWTRYRMRAPDPELAARREAKSEA